MRSMAKWAAAVVLVVAIGWGGLWWYAEARLHDALTSYAGQLTTQDGLSAFSYDSISRGTDPLIASATLNNVRWNLAVPDPGESGTINLPYVTSWIDVFNPLVMHVGLPSHIVVTTPRGMLDVTFGSFAYSIGLAPRALFNTRVYALTNQNLAISDLDLAIASLHFPVLHIDSITGRETINAGAGPGQVELSGEDSIDGVTLPPALVALAHVPFDGKITHIGFGLTLSGPLDMAALMQHAGPAQIGSPDRTKLVIQALHQWAAHGGHGKASLTVNIGPTGLEAGGNVAFDAQSQPNGTADVTADHLDAFTAALTSAYPQMQQSVVNMETQLSPYLTTSASAGQSLKVAIVYGKPGVVVNGTRMGDLPPIDWTALTNPPPPAQAPGDGSGAANTAP